MPPPFLPNQPKDIILWPDNVEPLTIFNLVQTQWNVAPMGGVIGLNYQSVLSVIALYFKKKIRRVIFEDVLKIEQGYLSAVNKKK